MSDFEQLDHHDANFFFIEITTNVQFFVESQNINLKVTNQYGCLNLSEESFEILSNIHFGFDAHNVDEHQNVPNNQ